MLKKLWHDPVWSKVIAGALLALGTVVAAYIFDWWPRLWDAVGAIVTYLLGPSSAPRWLVVLLVIMSLPTVALAIALCIGKLFPAFTPFKSWRDYTLDEFLGLRWRWRFTFDGEVRDLVTFCPKCDYQLDARDEYVPSSSQRRIRFHCDACRSDLAEFSGPLSSITDKVARLIQQKVRAGTFRTRRRT